MAHRSVGSGTTTPKRSNPRATRAFTDLYNALPHFAPPDVVVLTERVDIAATIQWENTNG